MAPTLKVTGRSFRYRGDRYQHGETFEAEEGVLAKHPNTLARVESDGSNDSDGSDDPNAVEETDADTDVGEIDPHPSDLNVDELEERLEGVDDVRTVEKILELEQGGKDRTTATDAIEARLAELEG